MRMMPLALKGMTMPNGMITYNMVTNTLFLTLNCVMPLVEGILITISNCKYFKPEPNKKIFEASIIAKVSVVVL